MDNVIERRASRRFVMSLPLTIRSNGASAAVESRGRTRDVSFRGLYFLSDTEFQAGAKIEFVLTLPKEVTQVGDVNIRCVGEVLRVEAQNGNHGVAARIEGYEFLSSGG